MIRTGELKSIVKYKQESITRGDYGEEIKAWTDFATIRAKINDVRGRDYYPDNSRQRQSEVTHEITHRYYPGISVKMEIHFGTRIFEILYFADNEERKMYQKVMVKERL